MWFGTQDGLARYDGLRFKVFSNHETDAFADNFVSALFVDRDGNLWVGTDGGELLRYSDTHFRALPALARHSVSIRSITQTGDGSVWVGSSGSGAHCLQGDTVTTVTKADGLPDDVVMAVEPRSQGGIWIGTAGGLAGCRVVAERAREAVEKLALPHARARSGAGVVTLSAGAVTVVPSEGDSHEEALQTADLALYRAKKAGRNRVEAA